MCYVLCRQITPNSTMPKFMKAKTSVKGQMTLPFKPSNQSNKERSSVDKYSNSSTRHKELTTGLLDMITDSMLPLSFSDTRGFQKFMLIADARYNVPSRRTLTRMLTNSLQTIKTSISDQILECSQSDPLYHRLTYGQVEQWNLFLG